MGCFIVHLLSNSEMLPNYSGSIAIMKTKPNQKKIIKKSEKKSFTLDGIWTHTLQGKRFRSDALACVATADWWKKSGFLSISTFQNFPLIANCDLAVDSWKTGLIATDRQLYDLPHGVS